jgi:hypothetical protein
MVASSSKALRHGRVHPTRHAGALAVLTLVSVAWLGCGRSPGATAAAVPAMQAPGTVVLPPGSALQVTDLHVVGSQGSVAVAAAGTFTATEPGAGPALVGAFDAAGHLVLLGYVDAGVPAGGEVSARQTAVALLFQALGMNLLPPGQWKQALALIAATPQADALGATVAARIAASATALSDGDAAIADGLAAAVSALRPAPQAASALAAFEPSARRARATAVVVQATSTPSLAITTVDTPNTQSGVTLRVSPDANGVVLDNDYRRHLMYFVYRTGYLPDATDAVPVAIPWEELARGFLPGTTGATSVVGTLTDLIAGTVQYATVTSSPVALPLNPPDAKRTYYTVVVVGAGQDTTFPASLASSDPSLRDQWTTRANDMTSLLVWKDLLMPALCTFVPAERLAAGMGVDQATIDYAVDVFSLLAKSGVDVATPIASGNYKGAVTEFVSAMVNNGTARAAVLDKLAATPALAAKRSAIEALATSTTKIFEALKAVDAFYTAVDLATVVAQVQLSSTFVEGEAKASKPVVRLSPDAATVDPRGQVTLTALIPDITGTFNYHWDTPGALGHLEDDRGHYGTSFDSTAASVQYVVDTALAGNSEKVTVEGYLVPDGGVGERLDLGSASSTVTVACEPVPAPILSGCGSATTVDPATIDEGGLLTISFTQRSGGLCGGPTSVSVNVPGQFLSYPGGNLSYGAVTYDALPDASSAARTLTYQLSASALDWAGVVLCPRALGYYEPPGSTTGPYVEVSTWSWWDLVPFTVKQP